jgi:sulfate-transporting ATPase
MNALLAEQATCRKSSTPRTAGNSTAASKSRWTRCAARRPSPRDQALGRRAPPRRAVPLLLEKPDLLLLDEPTNHLDAESVAWLENTLHDYAGTVMVVTHDRYFLDNVTNWILEIERGRGYPFEGNYSSWLEQKRKRLQQEEKEESARQRALAAEAGMDRSSPARARPRAGPHPEIRGDAAEIQELATAAWPKSSFRPARAWAAHGHRGRDLRKGYGNRLLIDDLNFKLPPGGIVGVIGPNGAGKTTLFRMITGQEVPDSGTLKIGDTVKLGYVDQSRDSLDPDKTVWQEISGGTDVIYLGKRAVPVARLCRRLQLQRLGPAEEGRHPLGR